MTLKWLLFAFLTAAIAITACNKDKDPDVTSKQDRNFLISANSILANQLHVGSFFNNNNFYYNGEWIDGVVKGYSIEINRDHQRDQKTIDSFALRHSVPLSSEPDAAHVLLLQQLKTLGGRAFDTLYANNLAADHAVLVSLCQQEANFGLNADIKHFATVFLTYEVWHRNNLAGGLIQYLKR